MLQQFSPTLQGYYHRVRVFLQHSEMLYLENKLDRELRELKQQNHNRYSDWSKKAPPGLTLLIISADYLCNILS